MSEPAALLEIERLSVGLQSPPGALALSEVSLSVREEEVVAVVGETGCGKTMVGLSVMGLLPPAASVVAGGIRFAGEDVLSLPETVRRDLRGRRMAMVFQEPMVALNPLMRVGAQIEEVLTIHRLGSRAERRGRALELLAATGIPDPPARARQFPHELSGGMRQRVMIAIALAARPALIIADEPTTALDPTVQAEVLGLLLDIREQYKTAILLITHDMGVVAEVADRVVVMYAGTVAEEGDVLDVFERPTHPYTAGLLASIPRPGRRRQEERLPSIPGRVPAPGALRTGCPFAPRCPKADTTCREQRPALEVTAGRHAAACFHPMTDSERAGSRKPLQDQGVSAPGGQPTGTAP